MRYSIELFSSAGAWLAVGDALLKATLVLGVAGIVSLTLRRASAAVRHLVWTVALVGALAVPALSIDLPRWQLPVFTVTTGSPSAAVRSVAPRGGTPSSIDYAATEAPRVLREPGRRGAGEPPSSSFPSVSWPMGLVMLWAVGCLVIVARIGLGLTAVFLMSRHTERVTDASWLPLARTLASELGLTRKVAYMRSGRAVMPMAWGIFRPAVLMPSDADAWPEDRLRVVLLHELAHVKRRDCLTHVIAQVVCAIYWFNPLAWIAARRLRIERELACDDLVLAAGTRGSDYANQLLEIARVMRAGRFPAILAGATLAMAHRSQLEGRLMAILDTTTPRSGAGRLTTAAVAIAFGACLMPLASVQPWTYAAERTSQHVPVVAPQPQPQPTPPVAVTAPVVTPAPTTTPQGGVTVSLDQGVTVVADHVSLHGAPGRGLEVRIAEGGSTTVAGGQNPNPNPNPNPKPNPNPTPNVRGDRKPADPKVLAALREALKDTDKEVREMALHSLVLLRDPGVFEPLLVALKDADAGMREQAAFGLGQLRDPAAVEILIRALKDESPKVREQVAFALGQLRDARAIDALAGALKDANASVRQQAAFALGQLAR